MNHQDDERVIAQHRRDQMLKLVSKGFYKEMINYGVKQGEVLRVASHLLDNLMAPDTKPGDGVEYYDKLFTLDSVKDAWEDRHRLVIQHVTLSPLEPATISKVAGWLKNPVIRDSFVPAFPETKRALEKYFAEPGRTYFVISHGEDAVGIVGGENIDPVAGKLEMKKLIGESGLQGKGIGKRATFGFLYFAFKILEMNKVYVHSRDINIRNLKLNSSFGFELEGVFFEDLKVGEEYQDVVRMALLRSRWEAIFAKRTP